MTIKGIIFDLYGTLIDIDTDENLEEIYRGISHLLTYNGIDLTPQEVRSRYWELLKLQKTQSREEHHEMDVVAIWDAFLKNGGMTDEAARRSLTVTLSQLFRGISRKRLLLYPEVKRILASLQPVYRLALVSDAQVCFALPEIRAVGLKEYFDPVIISSNFGFRKPDTRLYQKALSSMNLDPSEAIFVGNDMYRDIFGAQRAGLKTIFFESNQGAKTHEGVTPDFSTKIFSDVAKGIELVSRKA